jgi:hypothetical protein
MAAWTRRPRTRRLSLRPDGTLYDRDEHRSVGIEELCETVRSGRSFRAYRHGSGDDCTSEVLVEVLLEMLPLMSPRRGRPPDRPRPRPGRGARGARDGRADGNGGGARPGRWGRP